MKEPKMISTQIKKSVEELDERFAFNAMEDKCGKHFKEGIKSHLLSSHLSLLSAVVGRLRELGETHPEFCAKRGKQYKKCCACVIEDFQLELQEIRKNLEKGKNMTREIKFRAWDKNYMAKEMSYRTLFEVMDKGFGLPIESSDTIIMQFTGLHDKNGKGIYEGDILEVKGLPTLQIENYLDRGIVEWLIDGIHNGFVFRAKYGNKEDTIWNLCDTSLSEIIGNIYETPELLESPKST